MSDVLDLLVEAARNAGQAARLVESRVRELPDTVIPHESVKELEHAGDRLTGEIFQLLNEGAEPTLEREDVYALAARLDDVVDHVEHASDLIGLYKVDAPMDQVIVQAGVLAEAAESMAAAVDSLREPREARPHLLEVKRLEDEGDRIVRDAIAALFEDEDVNPREIIRWKDIFEALEDAVDACEGVAHLVGNVVVKQS